MGKRHKITSGVVPVPIRTLPKLTVLAHYLLCSCRMWGVVTQFGDTPIKPEWPDYRKHCAHPSEPLFWHDGDAQLETLWRDARRYGPNP